MRRPFELRRRGLAAQDELRGGGAGEYADGDEGGDEGTVHVGRLFHGRARDGRRRLDSRE